MSAASKRYMAEVKELPCSLCDAEGPSAAHHPRFAAGGGQKASDWLVIALCYQCHQGDQGIHGDRSRWRLYKTDEPAALAVTIERMRP